MALKFRRGNTAQQSGSLAFGEPYFNTDFNTLVVGSTAGDVVLASAGTSSAFVGAHVSASGYVSASSLEITGNANIGGDVTIGGKIQIGDNTSDTVNVVASLSSSLIPSLTNTFDLGDLTHFWRDLYISTGSIKMVDSTSGQVVTTINSVAGGGIQIGNVQITTASIAFVDNSGNVTQNVAASSSVGGTISDYVTTGSFNTYTSSNDTAVATNSASAAGAFASASSYSSSLATSISASKAEYTSFSASNASTDNTQTTNITAASASAWGAFQSASAYSSSAATVAITNANSAAGAFASASAYSGSFYTTINTNIGNINSNSQSAAGAFASASAYSSSAATTYAVLNRANTFIGAQDVSGSLNITGSIIPGAHNVYSLGSATRQWRDIYVSSGSIYMNGTAILSSNATDLTLTTDVGQSLKILETAADTITLQTAEGNIALNSTGAGDVILDPNTGVVSIKGTLQIQDGNKVTSSGGNTIQFGNNVAITGSLITTGALTVGGNFVVNGTTTTIDSTTVNIGDNIIVLNGTNTTNGGIYVKDGAGASTLTGSMLWDTTNDKWIAGTLGNEIAILRATGDSIVSGSSQITLSSTTGYSTFSSSVDSRIITNLNSAAGAFASASAYSGSFYTTINTNIDNITTAQNSANGAYASASAYSSSAATVAITNANSAAGAFASASAYSGSFYTTINTNIGNITTAQNSANGAYASASAYSSSFAAATTTINGTGVKIGTTNTITAAATTLTGTYLNSTVTGSALTAVGTITTGVWNGTAIANGNLANSSVTVTAGTGMSGGGAVALGSSVTLTNAGVTSNVAGTGVSVSGATGAVTISIGQAVATSSNVQFNSIGVGVAASATAGRIDASGDVVAYSSSDRNFKENITPIENPIEKIRKISGNTYDWKADLKDVHGYEGNDVGVIAQEIEEVLPQIVTTRENGYKAVKYEKLVALLIEGIKAQQNQIDSLTIEIENLKKNNSL